MNIDNDWQFKAEHWERECKSRIVALELLKSRFVVIEAENERLLSDLAHVTDHLEEWSRYHSQEMTCDIAAAIHNARSALRSTPSIPLPHLTNREKTQ